MTGGAGSDSNPDDDPAHADLRTRGAGHVTPDTQKRVCPELDTELVLETRRRNRHQALLGLRRNQIGSPDRALHHVNTSGFELVIVQSVAGNYVAQELSNSHVLKLYFWDELRDGLLQRWIVSSTDPVISPD